MVVVLVGDTLFFNAAKRLFARGEISAEQLKDIEKRYVRSTSRENTIILGSSDV